MAQSKRERTLLILVILGVTALLGTLLYRQLGDTLFGMDAKIQDKIADIHRLLDIQEKSVEIQSRYTDLKSELKLEGSNPEQDAQIRKILTDILNDVGLTNQYGSINPKDHKLEDDFKIISVSINQIECTPQQLGQLLYRLEKQSKVMEVENCRITNMISDIGRVTVGNNDPNRQISPMGLLEVDLQISRLVEYRQGEKPKTGRRS